VAFWLAEQLTKLGYKLQNENFFDTLRIQLPDNVTIQEVRTIALSKEINLRYFDNGDVGISVDETTTQADATLILNLFAVAAEELLSCLFVEGFDVSEEASDELFCLSELSDDELFCLSELSDDELFCSSELVLSEVSDEVS